MLRALPSSPKRGFELICVTLDPESSTSPPANNGAQASPARRQLVEKGKSCAKGAAVLVDRLG
jgi:hypothetical protein